jgi:ABC-type uncharacterized transport system substrate-binding protein
MERAVKVRQVKATKRSEAAGVKGRKMRKEIFGLALCATLLALSVSALAQQPKKVLRIGYLSNTDPAGDSARSEGIRLALRELGYLEGQNIAIEYRYAQGKRERFSELARDLVRLKVDIIVAAGGDLLAQPAKNTTKTIPIVMTGSGADPVEAGLVESLAHPGGNVTGVTLLNKDLGGKRLELLKETVAKLTRVALLYDPTIPPNIVELKEVLPTAARALGLALRSFEVKTANSFGQVFPALNKERPDAIYVLQGPLVNANQSRLVTFSLTARLPSVYANREFVDAGGLMYYGADQTEGYRRVAWYVDKIIKGRKPADLPVEQPTKFELVINLKTAKQIGLTIPPNVLARADRVIK